MNRNISCGYFYTSILLENCCLERNITIVGGFVTKRKGIGQIKFLENWEYLSTNVYSVKYDDNISVTSYVVKIKSTRNRNILVLSTTSFIFGVTKDNGKEKPAVIKLYDFTKDNTDIVDKRLSTYSAKFMSSKSTIYTISLLMVLSILLMFWLDRSFIQDRTM